MYNIHHDHKNTEFKLRFEQELCPIYHIFVMKGLNVTYHIYIMKEMSKMLALSLEQENYFYL